MMKTMAQPLPRLRMDLDFMPSPVPDRPGLLIRDPFHYSDSTLIFPPPLIECLQFFDGERTGEDLRKVLEQIAGPADAAELEKHLSGALRNAGFLHDDVFGRMREECHRRFAEAPVREPIHAGSAYPSDQSGLRKTMAGYLEGETPCGEQDGLLGIAAPHVSPEGGWRSYQAAYRALGEQYRDRVFVVLGTSHYGQPDCFGLTRKNFVTPFGEARTERALVDWLECNGGSAVNMEDYCHSIEHSIEFQVVFLQHLFGADVRVLPVLCGSFARSLILDQKPEQTESVRRFFGAMGELSAREGNRLMWVLGIDMAHMGRRYGDAFRARAQEGPMAEVAVRDAARIDRMAQGDADGFWDLVKENNDDLKWCGSSPIYTFLKCAPRAKGQLLRYEQWNIDEDSVVSFAGMAFQG